MASASAAPSILHAIAEDLSASASAVEAILLPLLVHCSEAEAYSVRSVLADHAAHRGELMGQHRRVVATLDAAAQFAHGSPISHMGTDEDSPHPVCTSQQSECSTPPHGPSKRHVWQRQMLRRLQRYLKKQLEHKQQRLLSLVVESPSFATARDLESTRISIRQLVADLAKVKAASRQLPSWGSETECTNTDSSQPPMDIYRHTPRRAACDSARHSVASTLLAAPSDILSTPDANRRPLPTVSTATNHAYGGEGPAPVLVHPGGGHCASERVHLACREAAPVRHEMSTSPLILPRHEVATSPFNTLGQEVATSPLVITRHDASTSPFVRMPLDDAASSPPRRLAFAADVCSSHAEEQPAPAVSCRPEASEGVGTLVEYKGGGYSNGGTGNQPTNSVGRALSDNPRAVDELPTPRVLSMALSPDVVPPFPAADQYSTDSTRSLEAAITALAPPTTPRAYVASSSAFSPIVSDLSSREGVSAASNVRDETQSAMQSGPFPPRLT